MRQCLILPSALLATQPRGFKPGVGCTGVGGELGGGVHPLGGLANWEEGRSACRRNAAASGCCCVMMQSSSAERCRVKKPREASRGGYNGTCPMGNAARTQRGEHPGRTSSQQPWDTEGKSGCFSALCPAMSQLAGSVGAWGPGGTLTGRRWHRSWVHCACAPGRLRLGAPASACARLAGGSGWRGTTWAGEEQRAGPAR